VGAVTYHRVRPKEGERARSPMSVLQRHTTAMDTALCCYGFSWFQSLHCEICHHDATRRSLPCQSKEATKPAHNTPRAVRLWLLRELNMHPVIDLPRLMPSAALQHGTIRPLWEGIPRSDPVLKVEQLSNGHEL